VQFQTGLAMPLAELASLAHRYDAELFVDAIQAVGIVPLDVAALGVDSLTAGSHKWLMAPEGCALLYVAPERVRSLVPRMAGWLSHADGLSFLFEGSGLLRYDRPIRREASAFEVGAPNTLALAGLEVAVDALLELGVPEISAHVQRYHDALEPLLLERGFRSHRAVDPSARSGILSLRPPEGITDAAVAQGLNERGISVANPDGNVRMAPHWPNSLDEVSVVVGALDEVLP
jgi:selenocysteine lyase/cysteine desulfurase